MNWRKILRGPVPVPVGIGILFAAPFVGIALHYLVDTFKDEASSPNPKSLIGNAVVSVPKKLTGFNLTDDTGKRYDAVSLQGAWTFVLLGYTHCPDVCPFTLGNLAVVYRKMVGRMAANALPSILFLSVDPDRDSPEKLLQYVRYFDTSFRAVTGQKSEIDRFVEQVGGFYRLGKKRGDGVYDVSHSAEIFVIDPSGKLFAKLQPPLDPDRTAKIFQSLVAAYESVSKSNYARTLEEKAV
ncbi:MAG: SCO family protein [Proteobacteria bacterium]|nr:SCO family protein [Pseudomonadota bacterium]